MDHPVYFEVGNDSDKSIFCANIEGVCTIHFLCIKGENPSVLKALFPARVFSCIE